MRFSTYRSLSIVFCLLSFTTTLHGGEKIGDRLSAVLHASDPDEPIYAWVYFTDKGTYERIASAIPLSVVSERSIQRRLKVRPLTEVVDYADLPVHESYIDQIAARVLRVRQRSKWFNSVSVTATKPQLEEIIELAFVKQVDLLARFAKNDSEDVLPSPTESSESEASVDGNQGLDYGTSFGQVNQINVPAVHNTGNHGQGVIVGVFDNGFRLLSHEVFASMHIIATYDFVDDKVSVAPNNPSPAFGSHGVNTLSVIGGHKQGQLIGPAFGASFILARTENDSSETPIEEDYWVAAIEWADSIGVDVTSTSLGYLTYDFPFSSWSWQDMNGNTTVITRAADMAVARGIVVVNSAGNNGFNPSRNTLNAPADGDSVLAVGSVTSSGTISSFSSGGPTTSIPPRIKPDILAQGSSVRIASATNPLGYSFSSGTSFSCPLAAGVAALILKARPHATPIQIGNALRNTASRAGNPDNRYGWGIIDAVAAINYITPTSAPQEKELPKSFFLEQNYPNPFNPSTTIQYSLQSPGFVTLQVYDLLGREVRTLVRGEHSTGHHGVVWNGMDHSGSSVASGTYIYRITYMTASGNFFSESKRLVLIR